MSLKSWYQNGMRERALVRVCLAELQEKAGITKEDLISGGHYDEAEILKKTKDKDNTMAFTDRELVEKGVLTRDELIEKELFHPRELQYNDFLFDPKIYIAKADLVAAGIFTAQELADKKDFSRNIIVTHEAEGEMSDYTVDVIYDDYYTPEGLKDVFTLAATGAEDTTGTEHIYHADEEKPEAPTDEEEKVVGELLLERGINKLVTREGRYYSFGASVRKNFNDGARHETITSMGFNLIEDPENSDNLIVDFMHFFNFDKDSDEYRPNVKPIDAPKAVALTGRGLTKQYLHYESTLEMLEAVKSHATAIHERAEAVKNHPEVTQKRIRMSYD